MKKVWKYILLSPVFLICGILTVILCVNLIAFLWNGLYEIQEGPYYKKLENYVTASVLVDSVSYDEESGILYLQLIEQEEIGLESEWNYHFNRANIEIVVENGILNKLQPGDTVTITVAPRVFGDGYSIPLAAITVGDEEVLPFNIGWDNLKKDH